VQEAAQLDDAVGMIVREKHMRNAADSSATLYYRAHYSQPRIDDHPMSPDIQ